VGLNSLKSLNLTNVYPNNNNNNNNKVKIKPLELYELAGKNPSNFFKTENWSGLWKLKLFLILGSSKTSRYPDIAYGDIA
jgi:hypothetical protein